MTRSSHQSPTTNRPAPKLQFERLSDRLLMAGEVIWENNTPPAGFVVEVEGGAVVFNGSAGRDKVLVHDIVAKKSHKQLQTGAKYIEIQHQDASNRLRRAWIKQGNSQSDALDFIFFGNAGNDHFQYFDSTGDPAPRRDRRIEASGGTGNDVLHGYNQNDILYGDEGNDSLLGELGNDLLVGGAGNDRLWGDGVTNRHRNQTTDVDYLEGGEGADELYGWQGGDTLNGGLYWMINDNAIDKLYGGSEADVFYLEKFADPRKKEPNDFSISQGDRPDIFDELPPPPSHSSWLATHSKALSPKSMIMADNQSELNTPTRGDAPMLWSNSGTNYEALKPVTPTIGRLAASVGMFSQVVWSGTPNLSLANNTFVVMNVNEPTEYDSPTGKAPLADSNLTYSLSPVLAVRR